MIDPVSAELEQRARLQLPWRWALTGALALHLAAGLALTLGGSHRPRALSFPSVQVRLTAGLPAPARPAGAPAGPAHAGPAARAAATAAPAPARKTVPAGKTAPRGKPTPQPRSRQSETDTAEAPPVNAAPGVARPGNGAGTGGPAGGTGAVSGGIALGAGTGTEEVFPFTYYLNRVLGSIESNWFKPTVPADTRCRVRCRIDRSGRLVEAGIEEPSAVPAFDRAALRAVYASAPYPPLPLGFAGASLTIHLEFGP